MPIIPKPTAKDTKTPVSQTARFVKVEIGPLPILLFLILYKFKVIWGYKGFDCILKTFIYLQRLLCKMRLNILIGGKAGQGINKVSGIVSQTLISQGYFIFNYRDYPSIIRGGHNFNVLSISDDKIASHESKIDVIIALDENTKNIHKNELKKDGFIVDYKKFLKFGINLNIALSGALIKILGIKKDVNGSA